MRLTLRVEDFSSLTALLQAWARAPGEERGRQKRLAESLRLHTTLVSQFVSGRRSMSDEHAARLCEYWRLDDTETEYVLLLARRAHAEHKVLKGTIERRLRALRGELTQVSRRVRQHVVLSDSDKARYYTSWRYAAVRLAADLDDCRDAPSIARRLRLPEGDVAAVVDFLEARGLLACRGDRLAPGSTTVHVPATSEYAAAHHRNWRLKALAAADEASTRDLRFTSPMTLSEEAFGRVRRTLLEAIDEVAKIVPKSRSECFALLTIDFLRLFAD